MLGLKLLQGPPVFLPLPLQLEHCLQKVQVPSLDFLTACLGESSELLGLLSEKATIIQSRWVCRSELLPGDVDARDLVLASFLKTSRVSSETLFVLLGTAAFPLLKQVAVKEAQGFWELRGTPMKM